MEILDERNIKKWSMVSKIMEQEFGMTGRSGKQCRERYDESDSGGTTSWTPASTISPGASRRKRYYFATTTTSAIAGLGLRRIFQAGRTTPSKIIFIPPLERPSAGSIALSAKPNRRNRCDRSSL